MDDQPEVDVLIVGAGAAGIGMGVALQHAGVENVLIVDRHGVGASFERWPKEMTFLTPSFPTNSIGMLDLNSIALGTSPAFTLVREHPSGKEYARYLRSVAKYFRLWVEKDVDVKRIANSGDSFNITTSRGNLRAPTIVWAAGEFQYPNDHPFPGAELCTHNAAVRSWRDWKADEALILGGSESGVDAAIQLAALGKHVTVLSRDTTWESSESDPSVTLATYTHERLEAVLKLGGQIEFIGNVSVRSVESQEGRYVVRAKGRRTWRTAAPPVLATGFRGSHVLVEHLVESREDGFPRLTEQDESTVTPGLFFAGPMIRHDQHVFCFIYKFRQRFAVVAKAIASRLGLPAEELETYRKWGMYLDDLSCCGEECAC